MNRKSLRVSLLFGFQNKKPALITQQNCVIRADFFRGATLIYLFASSVETTLAISITGAPGLSLARRPPHQAQPPTIRGPSSTDFTISNVASRGKSSTNKTRATRRRVARLL